MYNKVGTIDSDQLALLKSLLTTAEWKIVKGSGRDYLTSFCDVRSLFDWDNVHAFFFLKIPPGGTVHRHTDVAHPWNTYHIVVQTNAKAISYSIEGGLEISFKPVTKGIYRVDRSIEHWAVNNGKTARIHLLAEVYE